VKYLKIKSYCKINLSLRVIKKLKNGYHNIVSLITFCNLYDLISISQIKKLSDEVSFSGEFKKNISKKNNTVIQVLNLLREKKFLKNKYFKIHVQKNIPHGSGLGGGSSNAATLLNYFNSKMKLNLSTKKLNKLARYIGFDVPISLVRRNTFLTGKGNKIIRLNKKFKLNLLIVYPRLICSTKKIYKKNKKFSLLNFKSYYIPQNAKKLIIFLKKQNNDLEKAAITLYPNIQKVISFIGSQKGCYFSRITGSGSACIGIFSNTKNAINASKMIKKIYPRYWCAVSKSI